MAASAITPSKQCRWSLPAQRAIPSSADMYHRPRRLKELRLANVVPRFLLFNGTQNVRAQFLVVRSSPHPSVEVVLHLRKQACPDLPVRGQPNPAACSAKGLAHRRNNADLANSIAKRITPRRLARLARGISTSGNTRPIRSTISFSVTTISGVHSRPSSSGMNSMNRTTTPSSRANRAKPSTWSSLKPRSSTQLIFSGVSPAALRRAHAFAAPSQSFPGCA